MRIHIALLEKCGPSIDESNNYLGLQEGSGEQSRAAGGLGGSDQVL